MECYKELNKQLIAEVQLMRSNIAFYQRELNATNKQLMKEHQKRIEQEQQFVALLTQNYRNMINKLQPNADVNNLIANCSPQKKSINEKINMSLTTNHIQENFRRSTETRRSFTNMVSISPIHRNKSNENDPSDSELSASSVVEVEDEENEDVVADVRNEIVEEEDEDNNNDEETENNNNNMGEELVTSLSKLGILESIYEDDSDSENDTSKQLTIPQIVIATPKSQRDSNSKNSLRDLSNYEEILRLSSPAKEPSLVPLPSLPNTSTPRLSARNCSTFGLSSSIIENCSLEEPRRRPKRSCVPTNLTERNLNTKLRNDNSTGLKRKTRTSRSTRKNRSKD